MSNQDTFARSLPQFVALIQKLAAGYATPTDPTGFVRFSAIVDQLVVGPADMYKSGNLQGLANTDTALANLTAGLGTGGGRAVFKAADAAAVRALIGAALAGANSDITSLTGLTTALSVAQGGTGGNTQAAGRAGLGLGTAAVANTDNDTALAANSALVVATQQAVKTYIDNSVASLLKNRGNLDCSTNPNYPAGTNGDAYYVSVAGKIGGASGKVVDLADVIVCKATNAGGTEAAVGASWYVIQGNLIGALQAGNNLADVGSVATAFDNLARLTSTTYGRSLLALADAAALTAQGNVFTSTLKGLVPLSGGGTTNFLRADGTWAAAGGSTLPAPVTYYITRTAAGDYVLAYWRNYTAASRTVSITYAAAGGSSSGSINVGTSTTASPTVFSALTTLTANSGVQTYSNVVIEAGAALQLIGTTASVNIFGTVTATA